MTYFSPQCSAYFCGETYDQSGDDIQPFVDEWEGATDKQCYYNPHNYGELLARKKYGFAVAFFPILASAILFVTVPIVWIIIRMRWIFIKDAKIAAGESLDDDIPGGSMILIV